VVVVCEELGETGVSCEGMGEWWWCVRYSKMPVLMRVCR
jgi:hypothetical protein